jgi:chemotaxis protein CheD
MQKWVLNIGEVKADRAGSSIVCYGLGSCIGLFLYDRVNKVGGGAHIFLPGADDTGSTHFAEHAFEALLQEMVSIGADLNYLRAKIIGGANLFKSQINVGARNAKSVRDLLIKKRIFIASEQTGGEYSRTGRFQLSDGSLVVTAENKQYQI